MMLRWNNLAISVRIDASSASPIIHVVGNKTYHLPGSKVAKRATA